MDPGEEPRCELPAWTLSHSMPSEHAWIELIVRAKTTSGDNNTHWPATPSTCMDMPADRRVINMDTRKRQGEGEGDEG